MLEHARSHRLDAGLSTKSAFATLSRAGGPALSSGIASTQMKSIPKHCCSVSSSECTTWHPREMSWSTAS
eukprot:CAMPEP_0196755400 /NCGR_PEP_ID=MMETSP1091-20130531/97388_1 /TAXON_ID=302021 /ORGANISM="Rhodomonas sp., Strain CCMP768" /LENGTH=69 /DNA_ID=CAMNT_0042103811 /DNA_START=26 /DNA_END=232 /DNA_ORIENTATION=-